MTGCKYIINMFEVLKCLLYFYIFSYIRWHLPTADNNDCLMTQNKKIKKTKSIRKKKKMKAKD